MNMDNRFRVECWEYFAWFPYTFYADPANALRMQQKLEYGCGMCCRIVRTV